MFRRKNIINASEGHTYTLIRGQCELTIKTMTIYEGQWQYAKELGIQTGAGNVACTPGNVTRGLPYCTFLRR